MPKGRYKVFGEVEGVPIGTHFLNRYDVAKAGVHAPRRGGIWGTEQGGAYSVVLNGGYEDKDSGETIIYTGHGKGYGKDGNMCQGRKQIGNQKWKLGNLALKTSVSTGRPVRVIRGHKGRPIYSPTKGFRYDGLYRVVRAWEERGQEGYLMCRFELRRLASPPQLPLPCVYSLGRRWEEFTASISVSTLAADRREFEKKSPPSTWGLSNLYRGMCGGDHNKASGSSSHDGARPQLRIMGFMKHQGGITNFRR